MYNALRLRERRNRNKERAFPIGAETTPLPCTPSNAHLGRKNERLMRQRNIKRVLGAVPRLTPTESVSPQLEQLAMIRSSGKFVNCLPLGTAWNAELFQGSVLREIYNKEFFLLYPFIRDVFEEAKH
ncbi:hypothetical protein CDAR_291601 [Caerostris darwini]|uniref:Uncharacterized protein n=1 Tax=Caerostris darwini TaxID=1538125 RepID=A0AAV4VEF2_9ARAC|nr:hypothetical protein CDAR_291601 [Caerostris darwini]